MKPIAIMKCDECGKDIEIFHKKRLESKNVFCSKSCKSKFRASQSEKNVTCPICGNSFHLKPIKAFDGSEHCCSRECSKELKRIRMSGSGNHQYGLKGRDNPTWKSDVYISHYGYRKIRSLDHPFKTKNGFVFEHRLVAEKYLLNEENSVEINGKKYLRREYDVHHINENKLDNRVENLVVLTKSQHQRLHNLKRCKDMERDNFGRFVKKSAI